jgi:hypothetical protein
MTSRRRSWLPEPTASKPLERLQLPPMEIHPEDTLRFYALRMQELGMIKSSPQKVIAEGTDWRFLNELKRELKT